MIPDTRVSKIIGSGPITEPKEALSTAACSPKTKQNPKTKQSQNTRNSSKFRCPVPLVHKHMQVHAYSYTWIYVATHLHAHVHELHIHNPHILSASPSPWPDPPPITQATQALHPSSNERKKITLVACGEQTTTLWNPADPQRRKIMQLGKGIPEGWPPSRKEAGAGLQWGW